MEVQDKPAYKVHEVAALMGFSVPTIIKMFQHEPGVIIVDHAEQMNKRRYRCIRIPRAVYQRVLRRLTV